MTFRIAMRRFARAGLWLVALMLAVPVHAARVPIQFWHAMSGELGVEVQRLVDGFNATQDRYQVIAVNRGSYDQTMLAAIAAFRAGTPPDIVQVFDVGTATMMSARGATVPVYALMQQQKQPFATDQFIPAAASYYADAQGRLLSLPFNASTPVLYYNKAMLARAGVAPPTTWAQMGAAGTRLLASGAKCGFSTGWPEWIQFEQFAAWNGLPYASDDNGYKTFRGVHLLLDAPAFRKHLGDLAAWSRSGVFRYGGPESNALPLYINQTCAMYMDSSSSMAAIAGGARFPWGIAPMPHAASVPGAPQNSIAGGASLWVMARVPADHLPGIAAFLHYLMSAPVQAQWARTTGYVPVTRGGYDALQASGYYRQNPGALVAVQELSNKPPLSWTRGLRLGYLPQLRQIQRNALEAVLAGKQTPEAALKQVVQQGDGLLQRFGETAGGER